MLEWKLSWSDILQVESQLIKSRIHAVYNVLLSLSKLHALDKSEAAVLMEFTSIPHSSLIGGWPQTERDSEIRGTVKGKD